MGAIFRLVLGRSRWLAGGVVLLSMIAGASSSVVVALINRFLGDDRGAGLAVALISAAGGQVVAAAIAELLLARLAAQVLLELRTTLSRSLAAVPLVRLEELGKARVLATLSEDVPRVADGIAQLPAVVTNISVLVCVAAYVGWLAGGASLVWAVVIAIGVGSVWLMLRLVHAHDRLTRTVVGRLYQHFVAIAEGAKELRLHAPRRVAFLVGGLDVDAKVARDTSVRSAALVTLLGSWSRVLLFAMVALVITFEGSSVVPAGAGPRVVVVLLFIAPPITGLLLSLGPIGRARVAQAAIERVREGLAEARADDVRPLAPPPVRELVAEHVTYQHVSTHRTFRLGPVDARFPAGCITFVVGGNGSGKSTLAKLLVGLYAPGSGRIALRGTDGGELPTSDLKAACSAVFLDFHVFERPWGLALDGRRSAADEWLHRLGIEALRREGDSFDTTALSSGQRKRVALWVAILEDRPIVVLDECAAEQDPEFKELFYREILQALRAAGKIVIVVTHDDRYFDVADQILKLDTGAVVDRRAAW